ncbi:TIGR03032 family protein [Nostocaceae cyanobacterium CENA357]|uniref:TIGR03032 family protein n=1 Tax=Atlanticothrix silvestris CENA357 TaxID=1725252 RepID=A0A8J7HMD0_9CYAN|nr:TIGR03032 family protein [Atlanticothrix silvestris]MBH8554920.1 TIGR03032 family protein [Atlanticothrix silvestris CENA357]
MNTTTPKLEISASRQFVPWLYEQNLSLVFTTYQAGKVFFIGLQPDGKLAVFERTLDRCMGLYATGNSLYISTLYQLWRFENTLAPGESHNGHDAIYLPQIGYITGDLDIHDIVIDDNQQIIFANTLFSCLATVSQTHSFVPLWQPAAEDRCHLNGLAIKDGKPKYVSVISKSDVAEGWRQKRVNGGCIIDIDSNKIIVDGLSMPHSPRWYQGKLWLLNSGTGEFGYADLESGKFQAVAFCPGYQRGLAFHNNFAIVGISESRHTKTLSGLPLDDKLAAKDASARCGLLVIDLKSGDLVHSLNIEGVVIELYDIAILPQIRRPMAIGFRSDEIRRVITIGTTNCLTAPILATQAF